MAATLIGPPPAADAVERFFRAYPGFRKLIGQPPPGPTKVEAVRVGNAMVNREVGGVGHATRRPPAPSW
jgi:hypothetical protein